MQLLRKILLVFSFTISFGVVMAQNETETLVQTLQTANFSNLLSFWDAASEVNILDQTAQKQLTPAQANQKGFEGDMVLYGLAGFIRNILVCKDPASAHLLESIEGWREQYIETANTTSTPYLISALNILNESEIQFKMARNKRLHVELALIKLNFLQQAIELSMQDGEIVKKKLVIPLEM